MFVHDALVHFKSVKNANEDVNAEAQKMYFLGELSAPEVPCFFLLYLSLSSRAVVLETQMMHYLFLDTVSGLSTNDD